MTLEYISMVEKKYLTYSVLVRPTCSADRQQVPVDQRPPNDLLRQKSAEHYIQ